jgi:ribosomal protein S7
MKKIENKKFSLKNNIINSFMSHGKKLTCEKNLTKTFKNLQKSSDKNHKNILQLFIGNLTPIFKFNQQSKKRGKKKNIVYTPYLIPNNELRISFALKLLKSTILKNKKGEFSKNLTQEVLSAILSNSSSSIERKNEIQKHVLAQKRYFYKFRWYK